MTPLFAVRPSQVKITNDRGPLSAGKKYTLECAATGSRPAAVITWYKNGKFVGIDKTQSKVRNEKRENKKLVDFYAGTSVIP